MGSSVRASFRRHRSATCAISHDIGGLIWDRVKATNRAHKLLQTANIKLANVVADVLGVLGRAMLDALVAGETDPEHLAKLAKGSLTPKVKPLAEALRGRFASHQVFLLGHAHRLFLSTLCGPDV